MSKIKLQDCKIRVAIDVQWRDMDVLGHVNNAEYIRWFESARIKTLGEIKMFNKGQLEGILLSIAKPEVHVAKAAKLSIGYRVRVRVNVRGSKEFLQALQRTLNQQSINCDYKDEEHKSRPRPILTIGGLLNIWRLCQIIPEDLPDAKLLVDGRNIIWN